MKGNLTEGGFIMKKMFKLFFIFAILFSYKMSVSAKELVLSYSPFYYEKNEEGGIYKSWKFPKYDIDGETAYCIQFEVQQGTTYEEVPFSMMGIDESKKDRLLLISYYGYDYPGHNSDYYRAATQALLWELTGTNKTVVNFTTERYGQGAVVDVSKERTEIEYLVEHHYDKPNFNNLYTINTNEKLELESSLLKNYDLVSNNGLKVNKTDNKLVIEADEIGTYSLKFRKKQIYNRNYHFLASDGYQNMVSAGNVKDVEFDISIEVLGGKIKIQKKDYDTKEDILKSGIKFKIQNLDTNKEVCLDSCEYETEENGIILLNQYLNYGSYLITEVCDSLEGYLCNLEGITVDINEDTVVNGLVEVDFYNKRTLGSIVIHKQNEFDEPLNDVEFILETKEDIIFNNEVIIKKGELVTKLVTDLEGNANIDKLPLGKYLLYEVKTSDGYIQDTTRYEVDLTYQDSYTTPVYENTFVNYEEGVGYTEVIPDEPPMIQIDVPDTMSLNYLYYLLNIYAFFKFRRR